MYTHRLLTKFTLIMFLMLSLLALVAPTALAETGGNPCSIIMQNDNGQTLGYANVFSFGPGHINVQFSTEGSYHFEETQATVNGVSQGRAYASHDVIFDGYDFDIGAAAEALVSVSAIFHDANGTTSADGSTTYYVASGDCEPPPPLPPPPGDEGCTPGYWRNHLANVIPAELVGLDFDDTFGVDYFDPDITLGDAISLGGGFPKNVARHGAAAVFNIGHPAINYPLSMAEVIALVQAGDVGALADANELSDDCPAED